MNGKEMMLNLIRLCHRNIFHNNMSCLQRVVILHQLVW